MRTFFSLQPSLFWGLFHMKMYVDKRLSIYPLKIEFRSVVILTTAESMEV